MPDGFRAMLGKRASKGLCPHQSTRGGRAFFPVPIRSHLMKSGVGTLRMLFRVMPPITMLFLSASFRRPVGRVQDLGVEPRADRAVLRHRQEVVAVVGLAPDHPALDAGVALAGREHEVGVVLRVVRRRGHALAAVGPGRRALHHRRQLDAVRGRLLDRKVREGGPGVGRVTGVARVLRPRLRDVAPGELELVDVDAELPVEGEGRARTWPDGHSGWPTGNLSGPQRDFSTAALAPGADPSKARAKTPVRIRCRFRIPGE